VNAELDARASLRRWLPLPALLAAVAGYYFLFFLPPRLVGANEADRYYHLGLSRLIAESGLLRVLPQVEDLGWGRYFPDKEFLFHALTGLAWKIGGQTATLMLVPLLGLAIVATPSLAMPRALSGARGAANIAFFLAFNVVFLFRLTLLRPHLLAILFFCMLVAGLLRGRQWLSVLGAAGFALSYHALYVPCFAIAVAALVPWPGQRHRRWLYPAAALVVAVVVNPYFPGSLVMGWQHLKLALGILLPPAWTGGAELHTTPGEFLYFFGFLPVFVAIAGVAAYRLRARGALSPERVFLLGLTALLVVLSLKSARATEYAIPCAILLAAELATFAERGRALVAAAALLVLMQGHAAYTYFSDVWSRPQGDATGFYLDAIARIPPEPRGAKVFNCEWEAGSYLLYARPDLRFVDLLEPALLWYAAPGKYVARLRLAAGLDPQPAQTLEKLFDTDYILCANPGLVTQMRNDPSRFRELGASDEPTLVHAFRLQDPPR
jgi:hypothetical protein